VRIGDDGVPLELISRPVGGLLVVGYDGGETHPRAWLSDDATTWRPAADLPAAPDGTFSHLGHVVWTGAQYVAAGISGTQGSDLVVTAVWTSADGEAWRQVAELDGIVLELLAGGPGLVVVGTRNGDTHFNGAVAWSSTDGLTWTEAEVPNATDAAMADVVAFDGGFIAAGARGDEREHLDAAVWQSNDGVEWTEVEPDPGLSGQAISELTVAGGRLVAGTSVQVRPPELWSAAIWSSADGASWELDYERDCCGEFADLTSGPDPTGLLMWLEPNSPYAAAIVARAGGAWELEGAPDDPTVRWTSLVETESGRFGLAARNGIEVPLLLIPPAN
jgi:hypothetical protein